MIEELCIYGHKDAAGYNLLNRCRIVLLFPNVRPKTQVENTLDSGFVLKWKIVDQVHSPEVQKIQREQ